MSRRKRMMDDLDQDIRDYIERETKDNIDRGMSPEEAHYAALRKFGNVTQVEEETWAVWSFVWLEQLWHDVRCGLRQLRRSPGFTMVATLTLALGIGANTAIFSAVYAVLLKPLPFSHPGQLVRVFEANDRAGIGGEGCSYPEFQEWRRRNHVFSGMAAVQGHELNLTGRGEPTVVKVGDVTADFFSILGVPPLMGRAFLPGDDDQGAAPVRRHFRGYRAVQVGDDHVRNQARLEACGGGPIRRDDRDASARERSSPERGRTGAGRQADHHDLLALQPVGQPLERALEGRRGEELPESGGGRLFPVPGEAELLADLLVQRGPARILQGSPAGSPSAL